MRHAPPPLRRPGSLLTLLLLAIAPGLALFVTGCPRVARPSTDKIPWISPEAFFAKHHIPKVPITESTLSYICQAEGRFLATLAKRSSRMFEFGTGKGHTALLLARNSPQDAKVVTITLPPTTRTLTNAPGDSRTYTDVAVDEVHRSRFAYEGTPERPKIEQIFLDSKKLDEAKHLAQYQLVFVDGAHVYSFVKSDSEKALRMVPKGGVIVWHDYHPKRADVVRYLNELSATLTLHRIMGTQMVVYFHQ